MSAITCSMPCSASGYFALFIRKQPLIDGYSKMVNVSGPINLGNEFCRIGVRDNFYDRLTADCFAQGHCDVAGFVNPTEALAFGRSRCWALAGDKFFYSLSHSFYFQTQS